MRVTKGKKPMGKGHPFVIPALRYCEQGKTLETVEDQWFPE